MLVLILLGAAGFGGFEVWQRHIAPATPPERAGRPDRAVPVAVAVAERRVLRDTVEAVGTTRALQSVAIVPEADGHLVALSITPGDRVEKGDVLARLNDRIQRANLAEADARLKEARQKLERTRTLRQTNAVAQATLEEAVARLAEAEAARDRAADRLGDRRITAPFAGVVGLADVDPGARVEQGESIARLDDLSRVEVEFRLPETLFARARTGLRITARAAAFPGREFAGRIAAVDSRIDPVGRAFRVRAVIPNPKGVLPAGMFMSITVTLAETPALTIPEAAVIFEAAETYVFAVEDGVARRCRVKTGLRQDGRIAIAEGLSPGAQVVVRGLQRLRDGSAVNVLGDDGASAEPDSAADNDQRGGKTPSDRT